MCPFNCCLLRRHSAIPICILSGVAALCGVAMIVFSALLTDNPIVRQLEKDKSTDIKKGKEMLFLVLLVFSLVTITVSCLGILLRWCEVRACAIFFGIVLLPTWIIVTVFGGAAIFISAGAKEAIEEECEKLNEASSYS